MEVQGFLQWPWLFQFQLGAIKGYYARLAAILEKQVSIPIRCN